jgi:hypothetical protein
VTHLDITDSDVEKVTELLPGILKSAF